MEDHNRSIDRFNRHTGELAKLIPKIVRPPAIVLDAGCGSGIHSINIADFGYYVTAYDRNTVGMIPKIYSIPNIEIKQGTLEGGLLKKLKKKSFDVIYCSHVLEHSLYYSKIIENFLELLKPDGWLFLAVPPHNDTVSPGHIAMGWNIGQVYYLLGSFGFDVENGHFKQYSHSVFAIVQKKNIDKHLITFDDIFKHYPEEHSYVSNGIKRYVGKIDNINWKWSK